MANVVKMTDSAPKNTTLWIDRPLSAIDCHYYGRELPEGHVCPPCPAARACYDALLRRYSETEKGTDP